MFLFSGSQGFHASFSMWLFTSSGRLMAQLKQNLWTQPSLTRAHILRWIQICSSQWRTREGGTKITCKDLHRKDEPFLPKPTEFICFHPLSGSTHLGTVMATFQLDSQSWAEHLGKSSASQSSSQDAETKPSLAAVKLRYFLLYSWRAQGSKHPGTGLLTCPKPGLCFSFSLHPPLKPAAVKYGCFLFNSNH